MKRLPVVLLLISMVLTACSVLGAAPATPLPPTKPPEPSATPVPTSTPLPTDTPTPEPTATPDAAATAAAEAAAKAAPVLKELDDLLGDSDIDYKNGHLAWQQSEPIVINMQGPSGDDTTAEIDNNLTAGNFILKSDVTWTATGWMFCGAIFRSEPNLDEGKQYQFYFLRFSGLPAWYIAVFEGSRYVGDISGEQFSEAIDIANGATNQIVLAAQDNTFTVYFNGTKEGSYIDNSSQRAEGHFGFMAWQESGKGSCKFENSWIWSLDK
jgi:hypothetical protein